jgi:hypothetical protein
MQYPQKKLTNAIQSELLSEKKNWDLRIPVDIPIWPTSNYAPCAFLGPRRLIIPRFELWIKHFKCSDLS